jgi:hypothetical protein
MHLIIVNKFNHFFIQPAPGIITSFQWLRIPVSPKSMGFQKGQNMNTHTIKSNACKHYESSHM